MLAERPIPVRDVEHFIFVLAGKDPSRLLAGAQKPKKAIKRSVAAIVIPDHAAFVQSVYAAYGAKS